MAAVFVVAVACDTAGSGGEGGGDGVGAGGGGGDTTSIAYKLAVLDGDASEEADFQDVIDCIMATGIKGAKTETRVGDTLYASWKQSSQEVSVLRWGQILCRG
jgi:hypothetical protein